MTAAARPFVWDNHACLPIRPGDKRFLPQLARYRAAGASAVTINIAWDGVPADTGPKMLATLRHWLAARPDDYLLVQTVEDLDRAHAEGRLGVLFDIEGGAALAGELDMVSLYYDLGVRWMAIAYNLANALGGGCLDADDAGLTPFGAAVVAEMERVGMVPCCSHTGHRTAMQVLERASGPVICSHSNASAIWAHPRNIGDELIRACARTGGVVGVNGIGEFLGPEGATVEGFVRHLCHMADLVGPEHVAISTDYVFDPSELEEVFKADPGRFPPGTTMAKLQAMIEPEHLPQIAEALVRRGWSAEHLAMVLGGNWRRVARRCWKPAG